MVALFRISNHALDWLISVCMATANTGGEHEKQEEKSQTSGSEPRGFVTDLLLNAFEPGVNSSVTTVLLIFSESCCWSLWWPLHSSLESIYTSYFWEFSLLDS